VSKILATCPSCGDVCLAPDDLSVRRDDDAREYRFSCPICARTVRKAADDTLVEALLRAGVPHERDVAYRFHPSYVPPITDDEVSVFRAGLDDAGCLDELLNGEAA
jgi:hypothetical protein